MKKIIILAPDEIEYVQNIAKTSGDPRAVKGNFSRALRKIIIDHRDRSKA